MASCSPLPDVGLRRWRLRSDIILSSRSTPLRKARRSFQRDPCALPILAPDPDRAVAPSGSVPSQTAISTSFWARMRRARQICCRRFGTSGAGVVPANPAPPPIQNASIDLGPEAVGRRDRSRACTAHPEGERRARAACRRSAGRRRAPPSHGASEQHAASQGAFRPGRSRSAVQPLRPSIGCWSGDRGVVGLVDRADASHAGHSVAARSAFLTRRPVLETAGHVAPQQSCPAFCTTVGGAADCGQDPRPRCRCSRRWRRAACPYSLAGPTALRTPAASSAWTGRLNLDHRRRRERCAGDCIRRRAIRNGDVGGPW